MNSPIVHGVSSNLRLFFFANEIGNICRFLPFFTRQNFTSFLKLRSVGWFYLNWAMYQGVFDWRYWVYVLFPLRRLALRLHTSTLHGGHFRVSTSYELYETNSNSDIFTFMGEEWVVYGSKTQPLLGLDPVFQKLKDSHQGKIFFLQDYPNSQINLLPLKDPNSSVKPTNYIAMSL